MGVLSVVTFGLVLVTFLLWWRSSTNYGLGPDDGSSALLFGWRYSPTAITVLWIQLTAMLFDDVKRTEPYARLARPEGAKALVSILETPSPWWITLYRGFAKKKYGRRSWILICASLINIVGFLAISPLSSAYLYSEEMIVPQTTDFLRYTPVPGSPLPIDVDQTTHFRTIANLLQNVSTSPWITDNYTILPFWPTTLKDGAIGSLPTNSQQTWKADTIMFKSELSCTTMKSVAENANSDNVSIIWSSSDGCKYGLSATQNLFTAGGASWSNTSTFFYSEETLFVSEKFSSSNDTSECNGREIIIATEPWPSVTSPGRYVAQLCSTKYYMANISVTVALAGDQPEITFNDTDFVQNKVIIPEALINTTLFQDMTLTSEWNSYMISSPSMMGGASVILGALYDYNMTHLVNDSDLVTSAAKAKQRYLGEVIQSGLSQDNAAKSVPLQAQIRAVETRVVVQSGPALALGILFGLCFLLLLVVWWTSRLNRRPLNLTKDPATTAGVAYLVTQNPRARSGFQSLRQPSSNDLQKRLGSEWYYTDSQGLSKNHPEQARNEEIAQSKNGTPGLLRLPALIGLVVALVAIVVGICVLYHYAEASDLYQKAFVYQFKVSFFSGSLSSIAPFSMIPTIIAVGIGLWWSAMDENFRRLQPYLSMAKHDPPYKQGVDLSYQTSYWFWAATKAAFNKQWLLFLVTLGSTLSPICAFVHIILLVLEILTPSRHNRHVSTFRSWHRYHHQSGDIESQSRAPRNPFHL
jgi:hypothetical protein